MFRVSAVGIYLVAKLSDKISSKLKGIPCPTRPELLLDQRIPLPMYGMAPRIVLGQSWWNKERRAAYKSTNYHCLACGIHKNVAKSRQWMEGHERYKIQWYRGLMIYRETVPLCHYCHNYIHQGRLQWLLDTGKVHHQKYAAIIQHGDSVIRRAGLTKSHSTLDLSKVAKWEDWRLVVDGVEYPPLYRSEEEYLAQKDL